MMVTTVIAVAASVIIAAVVNAIIGLRIAPEVERQGLDINEHGEEGYTSLVWAESLGIIMTSRGTRGHCGASEGRKGFHTAPTKERRSPTAVYKFGGQKTAAPWRTGSRERERGIGVIY